MLDLSKQGHVFKRHLATNARLSERRTRIQTSAVCRFYDVEQI